MRRSLSLAVCVALGGCHCGQNGVVYTGPHALVTPQPGADQTRVLEFGKVRVASKVTLPITVQNDGSKDLTVKPSTDPATDPAFRGVFTPGVTLTLAAGETLKLPVEYLPAGLGEAMRYEWTNGLPALAAEGVAGAARFASGKGRHGDFGDL